MAYRSDPGFMKALWEESLTGAAVVAQDGTFLEANPTFCNITEYAEVELQGKRWQDITHPDDLKADEQMAMEVATGKRESYIMYKRYITKLGRIVKIKLKVTKVNQDNSFAFFLSQVAGVTEIAPPREDHYPSKRPKLGSVLWEVVKDNMKFIIAAIAATLGSIAYIIAEVLKHLQ